MSSSQCPNHYWSLVMLASKKWVGINKGNVFHNKSILTLKEKKCRYSIKFSCTVVSVCYKMASVLIPNGVSSYNWKSGNLSQLVSFVMSINQLQNVLLGSGFSEYLAVTQAQYLCHQNLDFHPFLPFLFWLVLFSRLVVSYSLQSHGL